MELSTIIKVQPSQVPLVWELVKLAAVKSQEVAPESFQPFCIQLLHNLLNGKAQCWARYNEEGTVLSIQLTQICENDVVGVKELIIQGAYSFKLILEEEAIEQHRQWIAFAKATNCSRIVSYSSLPRSWQISETMGWQPGHRQYVYLIGGE